MAFANEKPRDSCDFRNSMVSVQKSPQEPTALHFTPLCSVFWLHVQTLQVGEMAALAPANMSPWFKSASVCTPRSPDKPTVRLIGSDLPPLSCMPVPEPVTDTGETDALDHMPSLGHTHTVPGMGVVRRYCQSHKNHGD